LVLSGNALWNGIKGAISCRSRSRTVTRSVLRALDIPVLASRRAESPHGQGRARVARGFEDRRSGDHLPVSGTGVGRCIVNTLAPGRRPGWWKRATCDTLAQMGTGVRGSRSIFCRGDWRHGASPGEVGAKSAGYPPRVQGLMVVHTETSTGSPGGSRAPRRSTRRNIPLVAGRHTLSVLDP